MGTTLGYWLNKLDGFVRRTDLRRKSKDECERIGRERWGRACYPAAGHLYVHTLAAWHEGNPTPEEIKAADTPRGRYRLMKGVNPVG